MNPKYIELYRQLSQTKVCKERFGELKAYDHIVCLNDKKVHVALDCEYACPGDEKCNVRICLPPVFNPERPERCLWRMVDWSRADMIVKSSGKVRINTFEIKTTGSFTDFLDIALIKAILRQEGGEG